MRLSPLLSAFSTVSILAALTCSAISGDTIVLKNGRRIVATGVTQEADRVTYQTSAGQLSIPKSIVERIETDDLYSSASNGKSAPVSAPQIDPVRGYDDIVRLAVHDNAIDFAYLSRLESDARSGAAADNEKAAAANYIAAQFLIGKGDSSAALDHYRRALTFSPDNAGLLMSMAILDLRQSQFSAALDPLERARRVTTPSSSIAADIAKLTGWAYYGANKMDQAVEQWKLAEKLRPDPEVENALKKAERDKAEEENYREGQTAHFNLKYSGSSTPDLARDILRALEDDFSDLESQLNYTPPESIAVILYTEQSFADITRAPSWVGALNDGRIRIPVQGLSSVTPDLAHVLKHELTHSFVGQKSRGRAPTWLQEGIAQWMEGRRSDYSASALLDAAAKGVAPQIAQLDGSWLSLSGNSAAIAYAWSLAAVESIISTGGVNDLSRLLDRIASAPSPEAALRDTLHESYSDLDEQTVAYLRHS